MAKSKYHTHDFFCTRCGKKGIPIMRVAGEEREAGHLKRIYCIYCKDAVNHVEVQSCSRYDYMDFLIEFEFGNFDENGNRKIPYSQVKQQLNNKRGDNDDF